MADRPQMSRGWYARRARGQSNAEGTACESCAGKREDRCFSFSREKIGGRLPVLQVEVEVGSQLLRPWGIGTAAKTSRARVAARGGKTQLVVACGRRAS